MIMMHETKIDNKSLATRIKAQVQAEVDPPPNAGVRKNSRSRSSSKGDNLSSLAKRVAAKLEDGDFRGAVRLACSDDRLAPYNSATLSALRDKHPSPPSDSAILPTPPPPVNPVHVDPCIFCCACY